MEGVDPLAFANVFANNLIIMYAGALVSFMGLNKFFPLRSGSTIVFWLYFLFKCALWAACDATQFFGVDIGVFQAFWAVIAGVLSIVTYAVLYVTWDATILKIGLVGVLVDSVGGFTTVVVLALLSLLFTGEMRLDYVGFVSLQTFVFVVVYIPLFAVLIRAVSPVGRFICDFNFKHERIWTVLFMIVLVLAASTKTKGVEDSVMAYAIVAAFSALLVVPHVLWRGHAARQQRILLARTRALARAYDESLQNQSEFLADSRRLLDELAARISSAEGGVTDEGIFEHLEDLRASCDRLRFGTYSDNPSLDVMLVSWQSRFGALGVPVEYRIAPLAKSGVQAALAVQALFEWVFGKCSDACSVGGKTESVPEALSLHVFRGANQLLIELRLSAWNGPRFPRTRVAERMPSRVLSVREFNEGGQRVVRAIVEEEALWKS